MTHVFVHGNPETPAIWGPLLTELRGRGISDIVTLSPPGFGAPTPPGWDASQDRYREWLIGELERIGSPVHLVGHDWGAGHVYGVLAHRPDLLVSWAADCAGLLHPDYVWHEHAQLWQTPGVGEQAVAGLVDRTREDKVVGLAGLGIPPDVAGSLAHAQDTEMGRCILALYRSAAQPAMADLGRAVESSEHRPGLVVIATNDTFAGTPEMAADTARRTGANTFRLDGLGHWWMFDGAAAAADALVTHWASV